ncbi:MAG: ribonuclease P protein component [Acidobacteria bacterium RIFCSPLOWO2_02_FULL_61_28]|nr:MAG: ribonuclease P protein component [Acidobacteria bacterium RIFCSPLOWO2_02_FULL_61_28]
MRTSQRQHGLPKSARLLRTADYRKVYAEGRRRNLGLLVGFARINGERASRIGLTVSRAMGGAVERNRLKRRLREAVRKHRAELGPGWDIILQPRTAAKTVPFAELEETVQKFFLACAQAIPPGAAV